MSNRISKTTLLIGAFLTLSLTSCMQTKPKKAEKSTANAPAVKPTPRKADMSWANGKVNDMNYGMFVSRIVEDNPQQLIFNCPVPTVIDFYATWCGPCRELSPYVEKMAEKYKGKVAVYHVDIDKEQDLAQALGIQSIPMLIFANGQKSSYSVGLISEKELEDAVKKILKK